MKTIRSRFIPTAAVLVSLLPAASSGQDAPVVVGLLNSWGIAVPEAAYVQGAWVPLAGPEDFRRYYRRNSRESSELWSVQLAFASARTIEGGPIVEFVHPFLVDWGLITDFPPTSTNTDFTPRTIGPIVSLPNRFIGVGRISDSSPVFRAAVTALSGLVEDWNDPFPFLVKEAFAIGTRSLEDDWVYVRAERWARNEPACPSVEEFDGWVRTPGEHPALEASRRGVSGCDRVQSEFVKPMGVLEIDDRTFVIAERTGYESVGIAIYELTSTGPVRLILD